MSVALAVSAGSIGCATLAATVGSTPAHAQCDCSCPANGLPFFRASIAEGPEILPPNARIFARLTYIAPQSVALTSALGDPVPFVLEPAGDAAGTAFWIVPDEPLAPGRYTLSATPRGSAVALRASLVVEAVEDVTAPTLSGVQLSAPPSGTFCHALVGGALRWDTVDAATLASDFIVEVELWRDAAMVARAFPEGIAADGASGFGTSDAPDCFGAAHIPGLRAGEELTAVVRAWDQAGNASDLGSFRFVPQRSSARQSAPCGRYCAAAPWATRTTSPAAWLGAMLSALWWRRRTGARSTCPSRSRSGSGASRGRARWSRRRVGAPFPSSSCRART